MNKLHQLHEAINKLWSLIKKYNEILTNDMMYEALYEEAELLSVGNPAINDLLKDWIVKYINYTDKRVK